jgi:hypothetical protein
MKEESKVTLFDELLACVIQSSHAMDETARALAPDPLHVARVYLLNESLIQPESCCRRYQSIHPLMLDFLS